MILSSIVKIVIKTVIFVLFCLISSYVMLFGKQGTGIKLYYVFTSIFLWGIIIVL